jgi:hypothetical protein
MVGSAVPCILKFDTRLHHEALNLSRFQPLGFAGKAICAHTDLSTHAAGFVQRSGTHLTVDGKNFVFLGTNAYCSRFMT